MKTVGEKTFEAYLVARGVDYKFEELQADKNRPPDYTVVRQVRYIGATTLSEHDRSLIRRGPGETLTNVLSGEAQSKHKKDRRRTPSTNWN
jgi:hypothetical protein